MAKTYGDWLKEQREAKGWSQQELADAAVMSRSLITAIETGRRYPSEADAKRLDQALGTGDVLTTFRPNQVTGGVADWFEKAQEFEQQAVMIREFGLSYVPGFLQTEAYATVVIDAGYPRESEEERHKTVVTRLKRSELLEDPVTPAVWALLDEAVIRRPMGGHAVMADQLEHIIRLAESGRIRVNVLEFGTTPHPLLDGMTTLMWFEDQPPIAYAEGIRTGKIHDSPAMVEEIQGAYDLALSEALPLQQSLALLRAVAEEYRKHD
ncbi:helix-turn-helix domain-containing protein [Streptomyces noursei]|uniref:helix-turn-helix domain-containing protein n=1 Tax=Streptomyces noursei TaxID=1971 RepID=UPI00167B4072|nr:helix-turn-helix transcriptional regulator [Streptomyces noursei]MCZ1019447.1 helix-turn-helix transcriptional regulator [Streptomyces noursei]GGX08466.1 transcriptional regulator [Streptomyces noursei]